jgi:small subunit ribosomal protein S5
MAKIEKERKDSFEKKDDLDKKTVAINRVTKVVKGGRNMRFSALVVVGDKKGKVGVGMGKGAEVSIAIEKATVDAKRRMVEIPMKETTIPHEVIGRFEKTKVIMKPAMKGNGIIAGGSVRSVVELVGLQDITTKMYGSNNPVNCVKATLNGLLQLKSAETIAKLRGKSVEEIL